MAAECGSRQRPGGPRRLDHTEARRYPLPVENAIPVAGLETSPLTRVTRVVVAAVRVHTFIGVPTGIPKRSARRVSAGATLFVDARHLDVAE